MTSKPKDQAARRNSAERAIWGLVNDRYDVAARTPGLTPQEAIDLSRLPDMGDPGAPVDNAIAHLVSPAWGHLFARYYTNALTDSVMRLTLVYDVVRPSREQLQTTRNNAFRLIPRLPTGRTIEESGELSPPSVGVEIDESGRLRELLANTEGTFTDVLAAVLTGNLVLWVTKTTGIPAIETIILLLPVELRRLFTFQSFVVAANGHLPRLTIAAEHVSAPKDQKWTYVLPRDRGMLTEQAQAAARGLVALAKDGDRLALIQNVYRHTLVDGAPTGSLLEEVERLLRLDRFNARRDELDATSCVSLLATATSTRERAYMTTELVSAMETARVARGIVETIEHEGDAGWRALRYLLVPSTGAAADAEVRAPVVVAVMTALTGGIHLAETPDAIAARTLLAAFAAKLARSDAFITLVPESCSPDVVADIGGPAAVLRDTVPTLRALAAILLAPRESTPAAAARLLVALRDAKPEWKERSSAKRASAIGFATVRSALTRISGKTPTDDLVHLARTAEEFWIAYPPEMEPQRALRAFLNSADGVVARSDAEASGAAEALLKASPSATEYVAWAHINLVRNDLSARAISRTATFLAKGSALLSFATEVGALLRAISPADESVIREPAWLRIIALADPMTAAAILGRALSSAIDAVTSGGSVGTVFDACLALSDQSVTLDATTAAPAIQALTKLRARGNRGNAALRLRYCCAAIEHIGDESVADRVAREVWGSGERGPVLAGRFWLIASALRLVDQVRPVNEIGLLTKSARESEDWKAGLPKALIARLTEFLGLSTSSVFWQGAEKQAGNSSGVRDD